MKTIELTPAAFVKCSYESPEVAVTEIHAEGVLCVSNESWGTGDPFDWDE